MRWVVRVTVVLLLLVQGWHAVRTTRHQLRVDEAEAAYDDAEGEKALAAIEQALAIDDGDPATWSWLGDTASYVYRHPPEGGWPPAERARLAHRAWTGYAAAVLRCPIDSWSWSGLGEIAGREARRLDRERGLSLEEIDLRGQGIVSARFAVAIAATRLATELQPSGYQQLDALARIYEATGEIDRARESYVLSARMMPAPSFHSWGAGRTLSRALYQAIIEGIRTGLEKAPRFERSQLFLDAGRFAQSQGDLEGALNLFRTAKDGAESDFWRFQSSWALGGIYEELARLEEAKAELEIAYRIGLSRGSVARRLGALEARLGMVADACSHLREAARAESEDAGLRAEAARACESSGEIDLAEQLLKDGARRPDRDLAMARALLEFYRRVGRERTAAETVLSWRRDLPEQREFVAWAAEFANSSAP